MNEQNYFNFELRVSTTGQAFSFTDVPYNTTAQEVINAFMQSNNLDIGLGMAWTLMHGTKILSKDTILSTLIDENSDTTFELIAKVSGA